MNNATLNSPPILAKASAIGQIGWQLQQRLLQIVWPEWHAIECTADSVGPQIPPAMAQHGQLEGMSQIELPPK